VLAPLVVLIVGAVLWKLWGPAMAWTPAFAGLLERSVTRVGLWPFVTGLETAAGDYQGRPVLLALHHKRGRNSIGYLVVAMQPRAGSGLGPDALRTVGTAEGRDALDLLEGREGLDVSFDQGWLKVRWQPSGFVFFPGRFDAPRWRGVLQAMAAVAASLEAEA
jgi:hypothetical protein